MEVISYPPGSKDRSQYEEMLLYFGEKDEDEEEFLEGVHIYGYKPGQQCTRCGKGQLQKSGKKLHTEIDGIEKLTEEDFDMLITLMKSLRRTLLEESY